MCFARVCFARFAFRHELRFDPGMRLALLAALGLSACAGTADLGASARVECAPFARAVTGVRLYGPAAAWWREAAGQYRRTAIPAAGALLVFHRSARLPSGHVSVVSQVVSAREVLLTQANWLHGHIGIDQPARDVSLANDWTAVRVYWPPARAIGTTVYPTYGFILPDRLLDQAEITVAARAVE
jgi:surface antigen